MFYFLALSNPVTIGVGVVLTAGYFIYKSNKKKDIQINYAKLEIERKKQKRKEMAIQFLNIMKLLVILPIIIGVSLVETYLKIRRKRLQRIKTLCNTLPLHKRKYLELKLALATTKGKLIAAVVMLGSLSAFATCA